MRAKEIRKKTKRQLDQCLKLRPRFDLFALSLTLTRLVGSRQFSTLAWLAQPVLARRVFDPILTGPWFWLWFSCLFLVIQKKVFPFPSPELTPPSVLSYSCASWTGVCRCWALCYIVNKISTKWAGLTKPGIRLKIGKPITYHALKCPFINRNSVLTIGCLRVITGFCNPIKPCKWKILWFCQSCYKTCVY